MESDSFTSHGDVQDKKSACRRMEPPRRRAPVVRGEWVKSDDYKGWLVCSACRDCYVDNAWVNGKKWRYCPNCGALMEDKP